MDVALGVVLGMVLAASLAAAWRLLRAPRVFDPGGAAMQRAVHAATTILPHLRRGLTPDSAGSAAPALRVLTGADAVALVGRDTLLAFDGPGDDHHAAGDQLETLVPARREDRVHVEPRLACSHARLPAALGDRRAAVRARRAGGRARRAVPAAGRAAAGGVARGRRGGRARRRRWSSCQSSRHRANGWPAPSCARCGPRSRRTSSTTRSPRSPPSSTRGRRRRASC